MNERHVNYVIVGGVAMNFQGVVRATRDLDIFVAPSADNIVRLKEALRAVWDDPSIDEISSDDLLGDYPAVCYGPPDEVFSIDILTRLGEAFPFNVLEAEVKNVDGLTVKVATPKTLYRMKHATVRPQDRVDAEALDQRYHIREAL